MVGVATELLLKDFLLTVCRHDKEINLVSIGKLVLVIIVPENIVVVCLIDAKMLSVDNNT